MHIIYTAIEKVHSLSWNELKFLSDDTWSKFWYDGRTFHRNAKDIMKGIELNRGQLTLDFSYGDGFYLIDSFKYTLSFARDINRESEIAAVMFEMTTVPQLIEMGLSLHKDDWEMIVKYNHSGSNGHLIRESSSGDYVCGMVSSDGNKYVIGIIKKQMALRRARKNSFV